MRVKEKPIIFNSEMVRAILDGRKTQTRRIVRPQPPESTMGKDLLNILSNIPGVSSPSLVRTCSSKHDIKAPYRVGDRLWVKETHYQFGCWVKNGTLKSGKQKWRFKCLNTSVAQYEYTSEAYPSTPNLVQKQKGETGWHKRPSIFMPPWASRISLIVTKVRLERLQDISESDAIAEGILSTPRLSARGGFEILWNSIYKNWFENPWVWVVEFERV